MEGSLMNNYRVLIVAAVTLLLPFCLVPNIRAQSTNGSMTHMNEKMTHSTVMGQNKMTMSNPTADSGGGMEKMDSGTKEHMTTGHMMSSQTTEAGHGNMSDGGTTAEMSH
jgi:hypothetical protein